MPGTAPHSPPSLAGAHLRLSRRRFLAWSGLSADGIVEFLTVVPGWYRGRSVHIHLRVHLDDSIAGDPSARSSAGAGNRGGPPPG
jgi:hypothetical protein